MKIWIPSVAAAMMILAAMLAPGGHVLPSALSGGLLPVSTVTDAQTLYGRVVAACHELVRDKSICPPLYSDGMQSAVHRFHGLPVFPRE